jgi:hypothetical protein
MLLHQSSYRRNLISLIYFIALSEQSVLEVSNCRNYGQHVASMALHFENSTELDVEQVQEYLFLLSKRSKTPSQTYFKHCVYGLRFLLKSEGLPYEYLYIYLR